MNTRDYLSSLELLREFVSSVVPLEVYMCNLIVDHIETSNRRLWVLRENMRMDEEKFAKLLNVTHDEYHIYEKSGSPVPVDFLQTVAARFSVPMEWLLCRSPMLPVPEPKPIRGDR